MAFRLSEVRTPGSTWSPRRDSLNHQGDVVSLGDAGW